MSTHAIEILKVEDYPLWDSFVESSPEGTVFQTSGWIETISTQLNLQPNIITVNDGSEIIGGVVLYYKKKLRIPIGARPPLTSYNGILHAPGHDRKPQKQQTDEAEVTGLLLNEIQKKVRFAQLSLSPAIVDVRPFQWRGWKTEVQFTYRNSLEDLPKAWENLSQSVRRKINRAKEKNLTISESGDIETLLTLQEQSYARSALSPIMDREQFSTLCTALLSKGYIRIYSIMDATGIVHSTRAIVIVGHTAFDWIAGSNTKTMEENTTHLLMWKIFEQLSVAGVVRFDFLGANTPSIVEFKRSFGGILVNYYDVRWTASPVINFLVEANTLLGRIKRRR
jgi:CelD/BcsL family acetyltransferase involved in cellulose biosynthesis